MSELELVEFNAMIIGIVALINFPFIVRRRKDFIKYLPGIFFIILGFIAENLEEVVLHNFFAILEQIFILSGAILLVLALIIELKMNLLKNQESHQK